MEWNSRNVVLHVPVVPVHCVIGLIINTGLNVLSNQWCHDNNFEYIKYL